MTDSGLSMPAETAGHERTLMSWPARRALYGELMPVAEAAHAEVARTIAAFEPVTMIAAPGSAPAAEKQCGDAVEVIELPLDDSWSRDTGPIYVLSADGSRRVALAWVFNGWGEKYPPWDEDAALARRWAERAGHELRSVAMVLEGGSIAVDGEGTLVTTEQCLLHPNRNPTLTRRNIEDRLCEELGVATILWLPHGLALDDDTDGHVDNIAAFARPGLLVVQGCDDESEDDWLRCDVNRRCALGALDAASRSLEIVEIPVLPFTTVAGRRVAVPYLNYYVGNGFVVVPVCGHAADTEMVGRIAEQYPGRETIALDVGAILAYGGGGIHCITQQVPELRTVV
jgi:agmatine deiminase